MVGTSILFMPPSLTLILRHRFDNVCGVVLFTFFAWTHWVAIPRTVSPTRFTSAENKYKEEISHLAKHIIKSRHKLYI